MARLARAHRSRCRRALAVEWSRFRSLRRLSPAPQYSRPHRGGVVRRATLGRMCEAHQRCQAFRPEQTLERFRRYVVADVACRVPQLIQLRVGEAQSTALTELVDASFDRRSHRGPVGLGDTRRRCNITPARTTAAVRNAGQRGKERPHLLAGGCCSSRRAPRSSANMRPILGRALAFVAASCVVSRLCRRSHVRCPELRPCAREDLRPRLEERRPP